MAPIVVLCLPLLNLLRQIRASPGKKLLLRALPSAHLHRPHHCGRWDVEKKQHPPRKGRTQRGQLPARAPARARAQPQPQPRTTSRRLKSRRAPQRAQARCDIPARARARVPAPRRRCRPPQPQAWAAGTVSAAASLLSAILAAESSIASTASWSIETQPTATITMHTTPTPTPCAARASVYEGSAHIAGNYNQTVSGAGVVEDPNNPGNLDANHGYPPVTHYFPNTYTDC
ncbi:hypothetical protein LTR16_000671 [Cryomyces antarcticus]|uniref:Uncharacterized protein n=1 Tax=Cryomyces antarcticus TaxID=329879 RepID=A0ABR0LZT4_9PEZI|nr:hypothetical protein LTR39_000459 [Cryomyces antarcticus]KAK5020689.1 hypothetical protein LTR60_000300 [Cryomyces antarcticus]KAK5257427.1 hypothetical protein LTR16_000671 [Cryomyces antarcticus]